VPIGETLAEARQRAGLTVAQVSEQTRIREAVVEGIEGGDYFGCGGDFYARANIRSIAKAVGADSGQLVAEYDALCRARGPLSAVSLDELLGTSVPAAQPGQPDPSAAGELVASGGAPVRRGADSPAAPTHRPRGRWLNWAVVLGLLVVLGFGVYSRFSGPRPTAAVPPAAGKHAATQQPAGPGGPAPAPTLTHAAAKPAPAPAPARAAPAAAPAAAAPAQTLAPASAGEPGPGGGNAPPARRATGGGRSAGPARQPAHHRPRPEPALTPGPAPGHARPGHGHGRPDHHRRHAHKAGRSSQHRPGTRYGASPEGDA